MRKFYKIQLGVALLILLSITKVYAHSGRTDSAGGHHVRGTSEYHYHHGMSAHDHDGNKCPYDNIMLQGLDNGNVNIGDTATLSTILNIYSGADTVSYTTSNSEVASVIGNVVTFNKIGTAKITATCKWCTDTVDIKVINPKITLYGWLGFGGICISGLSIYYYNDKKRKRKKYEEEKAYYANLYGGKSSIELAKVPANIKFGDDKLPISIDESGLKWGKAFTVYVTQYGTCYHKKLGCCGSQYTVHLFSVIHRKTGCTKCTKQNNIEIPQWYFDYLEIKRNKEKYNMNMN
jgi:hypothetical protein